MPQVCWNELFISHKASFEHDFALSFVHKHTERDFTCTHVFLINKMTIPLIYFSLETTVVTTRDQETENKTDH